MKQIWQTWAALTAIVMGVGAAVAAHFNGIDSANHYTDSQVTMIYHRLDRIEDKLDLALKR